MSLVSTSSAASRTIPEDVAGLLHGVDEVRHGQGDRDGRARRRQAPVAAQRAVPQQDGRDGDADEGHEGAVPQVERGGREHARPQQPTVRRGTPLQLVPQERHQGEERAGGREVVVETDQLADHDGNGRGAEEGDDRGLRVPDEAPEGREGRQRSDADQERDDVERHVREPERRDGRADQRQPGRAVDGPRGRRVAGDQRAGSRRVDGLVPAERGEAEDEVEADREQDGEDGAGGDEERARSARVADRSTHGQVSCPEAPLSARRAAPRPGTAARAGTARARGTARPGSRARPSGAAAGGCRRSAAPARPAPAA